MPLSSVRSLRQRLTTTRPLVSPTTPDGSSNPSGLNLTDPLGVDVQQRGMANARAARQALVQRSFDEADPRLATSAITGPLPNPQWEGFLQSLHDAGATNIRGGPSPAGSTQLTGTPVQPTWMPTAHLAPGALPTGTAGDALAGVASSLATEPGSIEALRRQTRARGKTPGG